MKTPKLPFILFFLKGGIPTAEELAAASKIRGRVGYRNGSVVNDGEATEPCDGVAGTVPKAYKKLPTAEQAIANFDKKLEEATKAAKALVGERPPVNPANAQGKQGVAGGVVSTPAAAGGNSEATAPKGFDNLPGGDGKPPAWGSKSDDKAGKK